MHVLSLWRHLITVSAVLFISACVDDSVQGVFLVGCVRSFVTWQVCGKQLQLFIVKLSEYIGSGIVVLLSCHSIHQVAAPAVGTGRGLIRLEPLLNTTAF